MTDFPAAITSKNQPNYSETYNCVKKPSSPEENLLCAIEDIDYDKIISDNDLVFLGETHCHVAPKIVVAALMEHFDRLGFKYVALEMFSSDMQELLDGYITKGLHKDKLYNYFKEVCGYNADAYFEILEKGRKLGIKTIALDMPRQKQKSLPKGTDEIKERDKWMARNLKSHLKKGKILVLTGSYHTQTLYRDHFNGPRFKATRVVFYNGDNQKKSVLGKNPRIKNGKYMVDPNKVPQIYSNNPAFDWLINLPDKTAGISHMRDCPSDAIQEQIERLLQLMPNQPPMIMRSPSSIHRRRSRIDFIWHSPQK